MRDTIKLAIAALTMLAIAFGDMLVTWPAITGAGEARADGHLRLAQTQLTRLEQLQRLQRLTVRRRMTQYRTSQRISERRAAARQRFAYSRDGGIIMRGEIVAISPDQPTLKTIRALGFKVGRTVHLKKLALELVVLHSPGKLDTTEALDQLRAAAPEATFELNHLFNPAGDIRLADASNAADGAETAEYAAMPWPDLEPKQGMRLGLVDLGVDTSHPALRGAEIKTAIFTGEKQASPSAHGTAVASLLVGQAPGFHGAARGAALFAADVFGDAETGGSALAIVEALAWLAEEETPVIAMPLVGPPNRILELTLSRLQAQGILVIAPVGNEGPAQPVAYPAAYPGVVAVTATDWQGRVFIAANRGDQVMFSAVGVDIRAAADPEHLVAVSGTSYAVPEVAARLLLQTTAPDPLVREEALERLQSVATDLGEPGRDDIYGFGLVSRLAGQ